jgi:hypothetical protein
VRTGPSAQVRSAIGALVVKREFIQDAPAAHFPTVLSIPGGIVVAELVDYLCESSLGTNCLNEELPTLEESYGDVRR